MQPNRTRRWLATAAVAVGLAAGAAGVATAATNGSSASSTTAPSASSNQQQPPQGQQQQQPPGDPAKMDHGPGETLLTGDTATKVTAAAKAAIPDGTIIRVETDAQGSPYEAHVKKADGSQVTLKIDSSFKVTATENGFGGGPGGMGPRGQGGPPPNGAAPNGAAQNGGAPNGAGSGYSAQ